MKLNLGEKIYLKKFQFKLKKLFKINILNKIPLGLLCY